MRFHETALFSALGSSGKWETPSYCRWKKPKKPYAITQYKQTLWQMGDSPHGPVGRIFSIDSMSGHKSSHFTNLKSSNTTKQITTLAQVWLMISHDGWEETCQKEPIDPEPASEKSHEKTSHISVFGTSSFSQATGHVSFKTSAAISQASGFSNGWLPVGHSAPQTRWVWKTIEGPRLEGVGWWLFGVNRLNMT